MTIDTKFCNTINQQLSTLDTYLKMNTYQENIISIVIITISIITTIFRDHGVLISLSLYIWLIYTHYIRCDVSPFFLT